MKVRRAATICVWSGTVAVMALAPVTALADDPGNPGHHYGQISNPGHHYGQFKHPKSLPSPTPGTQPSAPAVQTQPGSNSANQPIGSPLSVNNPGSTVTDGSLGGQVSTPVASPTPVPLRNLWLTAILLALVLAANVVVGVVLVGRALHFVLERVRPLPIAVPSPGNIQAEAA